MGPLPAPFGTIAIHVPVMSGCCASPAAYSLSVGGLNLSALAISSALGSPLELCAKATVANNTDPISVVHASEFLVNINVATQDRLEGPVSIISESRAPQI